LRLQEQPARILRALLERPGEMVAREELRDRLWPGNTFVDFERSLNAAVAKLRQVLADSAEQPRYVETVPGRGYRLIASVSRIAAVTDLPDSPPLQSEPVASGFGRRSVWWVLGVAALVILASLAFQRLYDKQATAPDGAIRFAFAPPPGIRIHAVSTISPDGRKVAFVGIDGARRRNLWVRALDNEDPLRLENTDGALSPFFSPDSRHIGFFAEGKLKRISVLGGVAQALCDQSQAAGATWSSKGTILFSQAGKLYTVPAAGGSATELARPKVSAGQTMVDTWPQFLPDGRNFIVRSRIYTGHLNPVRSEIHLGSLDSDKRRTIMESRNQAALTSSGHLLFVRNAALLAQKLDVGRAQLVGQQLSIAEDVVIGNEGIEVEVSPGLRSGMGPAAFSVSTQGVLVYHSIAPQRGQLVWFDRQGNRLGTVGETREYTQLALSPDERWAALGIRNRERKGALDQTLWLMQLDTQVLSRLSFGSGQDGDPVWSPDSSRIVYGAYDAAKGEHIDLVGITMGDASRPVFYADGHANKPEAWSPDGKTVLFRRDERFVFTLPASGTPKPVGLLNSPFHRGRFSFSPDGRWLAYQSDETGRSEIYVSRFPSLTGMRQVSADGGFAPVWRKDGRELFYMAENGQLMSLDIQAGTDLKTGPPRPLFRPDIRIASANMGQFGVTENGQRFLVVETPRPPFGSTQMHAITRWDAARSQ
jgi:Tol biopolymer transport system component